MAKPSKKDFFEDMNKHPNTAYRMRGDNVIEVELMRSTIIGENESSNRVLIRVWTPEQQDGDYIDGDGTKYHWYIKASAHQEIDKYISEDTKPYDHTEQVADTIAGSDYHFRDFLQNNEGGVVDKKQR